MTVHMEARSPEESSERRWCVVGGRRFGVQVWLQVATGRRSPVSPPKPMLLARAARRASAPLAAARAGASCRSLVSAGLIPMVVESTPRGERSCVQHLPPRSFLCCARHVLSQTHTHDARACCSQV